MHLFALDSPDFVSMVYTSDWHLAEKAPGRRTGSYAADVLKKIAFVSNLAHERQAISVCGGDVFHIKDPRSAANGFGLVNPLIKTLKEMPYGQVFGDHGNHDLLNDRYESLPTQPLGALIAAKVFHDLSADPIVFISGDRSVSVSLEAYPYADDMVTLERVLAAPPRPEWEGEPVQFRVAILHQYGHPGPQGSMFGHATIGYDQLADCDYDIILWGHDHSREKTVTVGNVTHIRLGSLARAALSSDEVDRPVMAAGLTFSAKGVVFKELPIPVKPLEIAFVMADKGTEKVIDTQDVSDFLFEMDVAVSEVESSDPRAVVTTLCGDEKDVLDTALEWCEL